jgi:glycosyltransferase involved in cell wall biosynthesis
MTIRISAIVSTYNSERFFEGKLRDLLGQTCAESLEIIIIDSGSCENERAITEGYQARHENIVYVRTERETVYAAWNRGVRLARGEYITNANTDDRLRPDAFEILAAELDSDHDVALVYGDFYITGYENQTFYDHIRTGYSNKPEFSPAIMLSGCHMGPQPMWRKRVHETIGYFDEVFQAAGDYEFWCRLARAYSMKHIRRYLGLYYHNRQGICNRNTPVVEAETVRVKSHYADYFPPANEEIAGGFFYAGKVYENACVHIVVRVDQTTACDFLRTVVERIFQRTRFPYRLTVFAQKTGHEVQSYLAGCVTEGMLDVVPFRSEILTTGEILSVCAMAQNVLFLQNTLPACENNWLRNISKFMYVNTDVGALAFDEAKDGYSVCLSQRLIKYSFEEINRMPFAPNVVSEWVRRSPFQYSRSSEKNLQKEVAAFR